MHCPGIAQYTATTSDIVQDFVSMLPISAIAFDAQMRRYFHNTFPILFPSLLHDYATRKAERRAKAKLATECYKCKSAWHWYSKRLQVGTNHYVVHGS
jgi:hypothetical protein